MNVLCTPVRKNGLWPSIWSSTDQSINHRVARFSSVQVNLTQVDYRLVVIIHHSLGHNVTDHPEWSRVAKLFRAGRLVISKLKDHLLPQSSLTRVTSRLSFHY